MAKYKEGKHKGFSRYLIAQRAVLTLSSEEFADFKRLGLEMGFRWVESAPLVRSSYHADQQADALSVRHRRQLALERSAGQLSQRRVRIVLCRRPRRNQEVARAKHEAADNSWNRLRGP